MNLTSIARLCALTTAAAFCAGVPAQSRPAAPAEPAAPRAASPKAGPTFELGRALQETARALQQEDLSDAERKRLMEKVRGIAARLERLGEEPAADERAERSRARAEEVARVAEHIEVARRRARESQAKVDTLLQDRDREAAEHARRLLDEKGFTPAQDRDPVVGDAMREALERARVSQETAREAEVRSRAFVERARREETGQNQDPVRTRVLLDRARGNASPRTTTPQPAPRRAAAVPPGQNDGADVAELIGEVRQHLREVRRLMAEIRQRLDAPAPAQPRRTATTRDGWRVLTAPPGAPTAPAAPPAPDPYRAGPRAPRSTNPAPAPERLRAGPLPPRGRVGTQPAPKSDAEEKAEGVPMLRNVPLLREYLAPKQPSQPVPPPAGQAPAPVEAPAVPSTSAPRLRLGRPVPPPAAEAPGNPPAPLRVIYRDQAR